LTSSALEVLYSWSWKTLTVREASALTSLSAHTLRYYERAGLIEPVARTPTGHRRYARDDLEHLRFLHCLRATGMSIRRMQEFAALVRQGQGARPAALALLETHGAEVQARIAALGDSLKVIDRKIERFGGVEAAP